MTFTVAFGPQFVREWTQYKQDQKAPVGDFLALVKVHGLDQTKLPGKLSPSWIGASQADFAFAQQYSLWHYHLGYPAFRQNGPGTPMTSEWVLHFQWAAGTRHIDVVDMYVHYLRSGRFYLPPVGSLVTAPPSPTAAPASGASSAAPPDASNP
jgi:hypothetical protein